MRANSFRICCLGETFLSPKYSLAVPRVLQLIVIPYLSLNVVRPSVGQYRRLRPGLGSGLALYCLQANRKRMGLVPQGNPVMSYADMRMHNPHRVPPDPPTCTSTLCCATTLTKPPWPSPSRCTP